MFIHLMDETEPHRHERVAEARECEQNLMDWLDGGPTCSICDGAGHGYPGGRPCPLEVDEVASWETDQDELRAAALFA